MKKTINRFLSLLLAVIMVLGMLPMTVFAENSELPKPTFRIEFASKYEQWDPNKKSFKAGDPIHYAIVVDNTTTDHTVIVNKITFHCGQDPEQTWENESNLWTTPHGTQTHGRFKHVVTERDVANGACIPKAEIEYTIYIDADDEEGVSGLNGTAEGYTQLGTSSGLKGVSVHKYVTSSPANGARYEEGEKVTFVTLITNNSSETLKDLVVHEDRHGEFHDITTADLAPNQTAKVYGFDYVNHSDFLRGCLYSYSTITWDGWQRVGDPNKENDAHITSNTVKVRTMDSDPNNTGSFVSIEISAKNPPENGVAYQLGETIDLKFEVVNRSFQSDAKSLEVFTTQNGWHLSSNTIEKLSTQTLWDTSAAYHIVDLYDVLRGEVKVQAWVDAWDAETGEYCGSVSNVLSVPVSGTVSRFHSHDVFLTQKLENKPANGEYYVPGETVNINVTVDPRFGGVFDYIKIYPFNTLSTGNGTADKDMNGFPEHWIGVGRKDVTITHVVTNEDAQRGSIRSDICAYAEYRIMIDSDGEKYEVGDFVVTGDPLVVPCGYAEVTGKMDVELKQVFEPNNGTAFVPGEYVMLQYTVENSLSAPLMNPSASLTVNNGGGVDKTIDLSGDLPKVMDTWHRNFTSYKVTQEDAQKGSISFTYSINGTTRDGKSHIADSDPVVVSCGMPTDPALGIYMTETSTPANGEYYELGDTITYKVTIVNNGSKDLGECVVTDFQDPIGSVEQLGIGEEKFFAYSIDVTESFVNNGFAMAMAEVQTTYNGEQIGSDCYALSRTGAKELPIWSITKSVTSSPANGEYYTQGETIAYKIAVQKGEETMGGAWEDYEFRVIDELTGDMTLCDFEGKDSFEMTANYVVTRADVTAESVTNIANLQWRTNTDRNWGCSMASNAVTVTTGADTPAGPGEDEEPESAEYAIEVTKIIEGENAPTDTRFSFQFKDGYKTRGMFITGAGTNAFAPLRFTEAGTYTYTVSEVNSGKEGWTYDSSKIQVSIEIIEDRPETGEPALKVGTVTFTKDGAPVNGVSFTNTYTGSGSGTTPGTGGSGSGTTPGTGGTDKPAGTGKDPWNDPFVDVSENDWFCEDVRFAYENELMNGTGGNMFSPYISTTRGMIVTILWRLEGKPAASGVCPFDDVKPGSYYEDAITWAAQNDIVNGYGYGKFGPDDPITREQMAAILYRYAEYKGCDVSVGEDTNILSYEDAFKISEYAYTPLQWACGEGLIGGYNGYLTPTASATRAQVAAILHRFFDKFVK